MSELLQEVRQRIGGLAADRDKARGDLAAATEAVAGAADEAAALAAVGDAAGAETAKQKVESLRVDRRAVLDRLSSIDTDVVTQLQRLVEQQIDPCDAEPDVPLLLLPVRIETRFSDDKASLRVRIYPDDVHVDRLDRGVSKSESAAGTAYWTAVWTGTAAEDAAWNALLQAVHPRRAAWVAFALAPTNLEARPDPPGSAPPPVFPDVAPRTNSAPTARALPDRFVVVAQQGGETSTAIGRPVPPTVVVGFASDDPASLLTHNGVTLGSGMEWLADYDRAEETGLAVTLPLTHPGEPVDTLLAFGVRVSLDPVAAATEVRELLLSHRFGDGLAFVPQGTPTNNTETDRAAWTMHPAPSQPATRVSPPPDAGSNVSVLTRALGIDAGELASAAAADLGEQPLAAAANTALWPATWGTLLDRFLASYPGGGPDDEQREELRDLFQTHVRGRGPLPALRLGDQPYGVLPVSSVAGRWSPDPNDRLEPALVQVLGRAHSIWTASAGGIPSLPTGGALDDALLEILGSAPQLLGIRVRSVASESMCEIVPPLLGLDGIDTDLQRVTDLIAWGLLGLPADLVGLTGTLAKTTRPLGLPLADDTDPAFISALLDGRDRKVSSVLQALLELAYDASQRAVAAASPRQQTEQLYTVAGDTMGDLAHEVRRVLDDTVGGTAAPGDQVAMARSLGERFGVSGPVTLALADPVAGVRSSLASLALQPNVPADTISTLALQALGAWFRANSRLTQVREALGVLAAATTEERRVAAAETLDCSSHRLDAWTTAVVSRRLEQLRTFQADGVLLGAYGFVEGIAPDDGAARDGGYVLAPSLQHAATAGVLRSAYLNHNPDGSGGGAFAIDLSSARVRAAVDLIEGIRNGQPLGALLGYRFERTLHESPLGLDRFVLSLRALAPLVGGKKTDHAEAMPREASEVVAATNVVDGVQLLALRKGGSDIRTALGVRPSNQYLDPNRPWTGPDDGQWTALDAAMGDMENAYDAVADVVLAEAVHHLVQGNTARAGAALDALAGDALPADPDVGRIPARGAAITHRVLLLARDPAAGLGGWSATTPRATAEPRLAGWAEAMLGPANRIVVQVAPGGARTTLDRAGLSALDVVCDSATPGLLERRLRQALPSLSPQPLAAHRRPDWPAGLVGLGEAAAHALALQQLLVKAQPALPPSFARPSDAPQRRVLGADVAELKARVTAAATALGAATDGLTNALAATPARPKLVAAAIGRLAQFGLTSPGARPGDEIATGALLADAQRRQKAAATALAASPFGPAEGIAAGKAVFGEAFWTLPVVSKVEPDLFGAALDGADPSPATIRRFMRDAASVRDGLAAYGEALLIGDALGVARALQVAQLAPSGTPGTGRWLGLPFDPNEPSPDVPVASVVVDAATALAGGDRVAGLVVDEWIEVVPMRVERPDGNGGTVREAMVTAGVAVNIATPSARAPQSLLLALSPDGARWSTDAVAGVLRETLELAKLRGVTLERLLWMGRILPALYEQSWSLQGEESLDILTLSTSLGRTEAMMPFVKELA